MPLILGCHGHEVESLWGFMAWYKRALWKIEDILRRLDWGCTVLSHVFPKPFLSKSSIVGG